MLVTEDTQDDKTRKDEEARKGIVSLRARDKMTEATLHEQHHTKTATLYAKPRYPLYCRG